MLIFLTNSPLTVVQVSPVPPHTPHWSSVVFESTIQSHPTFCKWFLISVSDSTWVGILFTHFTYTTNAHVVQSNLAWCSIIRTFKVMNHRVFFIGAVKFTRVMWVEERQPRVMLSFNHSMIFLGALLCSESWLIFGTRVNVASLISRPLTNAEGTTVNWRRMIAFTCLHWNSSSTWSWTWSPLRPITPTTVDRLRKFFNIDTFLILAPLMGTKKIVKSLIARKNKNSLYDDRNVCQVQLVLTMSCKFRSMNTRVASKSHPTANTPSCFHL